jgi:hypothetical protein
VSGVSAITIRASSEESLFGDAELEELEVDIPIVATPNPIETKPHPKPPRSKGKEKVQSSSKRKRSISESIVDVSPPKRARKNEPSAPRHKRPIWPPGAEPLGGYHCTICWSPPKNATIIPCGHIYCGKCIWDAVDSMLRAQQKGPESERGPRCPECKTKIEGWDGRGGGTRGLKIAVETVFK